MTSSASAKLSRSNPPNYRPDLLQEPASKLESPVSDVIKRLCAGGIAGSVAKSVIAPLDRTKIIFQTSNKVFSYRNAHFEMLQIWRQEGILGLWRGNSATVIRVFPYAGIQFAAFDVYKKMFAESDTGRLTSLQRLAAGSAAGATSVIFTYPLDLLRARLAVQRLWAQRLGPGDSLRDAITGGTGRLQFKELYRGLFPTLLGILPYAGIAFYTRDTLNNLAAQHLETTSADTPLSCKLASGAVSALTAQSLTYPLDLVRRRMQTDGYLDGPAAGGKGHANTYLTVRGTLSGIYVEEGVRGLFKGLSMNWIKGPVAFMLSYTLFDYLKIAMHIRPALTEDFRRVNNNNKAASTPRTAIP